MPDIDVDRLAARLSEETFPDVIRGELEGATEADRWADGWALAAELQAVAAGTLPRAGTAAHAFLEAHHPDDFGRGWWEAVLQEAKPTDAAVFTRGFTIGFCSRASAIWEAVRDRLVEARTAPRAKRSKSLPSSQAPRETFHDDDFSDRLHRKIFELSEHRGAADEDETVKPSEECIFPCGWSNQ